MTKLLTLNQILRQHEKIIAQSGGGAGIRDYAGLESAVAQPEMSFGGEDLYPTVIEKAAALGFSLIMNHPFVDGNKRIGQIAMEATLLLNGYEINASVDEQEAVILSLAAGELSREDFTEWLRQKVVKLAV
jgi:death-on-curing protein